MKQQKLTTAVQCSKVIKTYTDGTTKVTALRGVELDIKEGELLMLAGPSGCGKTTLISIIAGILDHDSGTCQVFGHKVSEFSPFERIKFRAKNIGFVFQAFNLMPTLTASENVAVPLIINGMERHAATLKANEMLAQMGLSDKTDSLPVSLSGGQQQRVAIARALIHDPRLIVCDEPTSALDGETGQLILGIMKKIAMDQKRSLIVVTHDIRIYPFADRIALMEDGKIKKIVTSYKDAIKN